MKYIPILMSGDMVRANREGRKTETRRVLKHQPAFGPNPGMGLSINQSAWWIAGARYAISGTHCPLSEIKKPYGLPGDRLWVRETHIPTAAGVIYRADHSDFEAAGIGGLYGGWKPSIFMRRPHSRLTLEVMAVRVERLQAITEAGAIAEGILPDGAGWCGFAGGPWQRHAVDAYRNLWESINGAGSWEQNPWVWVVQYKVLTAGNAKGF